MRALLAFLVAALVAGCGGGMTFVIQGYPGSARPRNAVAWVRVNAGEWPEVVAVDGRPLQLGQVLEPGNRVHVEVLPGPHVVEVAVTEPGTGLNRFLSARFGAEAGRVYRVEVRSLPDGEWAATPIEVDPDTDARLRSVPEPPAPPGREPAPSPVPPSDDPLAPLHDFENGQRASTDFAHAPTSDEALGPDPYVIRVLAREGASHAGPELVGLLRGRNEVVQLDGSLHEMASAPAPASPSGMAVAADGEVFVVGELSSEVARYRRVGGRLERTGSVRLPGVVAMRDVATGPEGVLYVVEEHEGRLLTVRPSPGAGDAGPLERVDTPLCQGPIRISRTSKALVIDCLLDHALVVRPVDARGFPAAGAGTRIVHDGPIWGFDAVDDAGALLVAMGGIEDHPLDRTGGSFAFIDSFVTLVRVTGGATTERSVVNTSAFGLVTPKALVLRPGREATWEVTVAGYGSPCLATLTWERSELSEANHTLSTPRITTLAVPPGSAALAGVPDGPWFIANPLLDAWVRVAQGGAEVVAAGPPAGAAEPSADVRLGEALFFTTLMSPWNKSDGPLSRFTCEACHFEGYVDGRVHRTGRGDVRATTKPLHGLFNNRPYFSRALDPDLATMVDNEFDVAGAKSDHDPWFSLSTGSFPWLEHLSVPPGATSPVALRRALMSFLMAFTHRPNPSTVGRARWSETELAGARVFRDRCESCHEARLVADDVRTRVPFEQWEHLVMSREAPLVWAKAEYAKTGVVPYVSERGARIVSLRRLYKKRPYFTNGSAPEIAAVLERARFAADGTFFHDGAPEDAAPLREVDQRELEAFLDLL